MAHGRPLEEVKRVRMRLLSPRGRRRLDPTALWPASTSRRDARKQDDVTPLVVRVATWPRLRPGLGLAYAGLEPVPARSAWHPDEAAAQEIEMRPPNIWRFSIFKRLIWPSTGPLLHGTVTPALTAA